MFHKKPKYFALPWPTDEEYPQKEVKRMTNYEIQQIRALQCQGLGYRRIAAMLNLSPNSVKSYCQRHPLKPAVKADGYCKQCGSPLTFVVGKKKRQFCSDRCRQIWWNAHREEVNKRTFHERNCLQCGQRFSVYGRTAQLYCSRRCFAASRRKVAK